jgi:uncharacterized protein YhbP (UPF0306 family)
MDSNTEAAVAIIRANRYLTLATGLDESVWAAPLAYVVDENLRFYWYSALEARHSQHIASNPSVAAAIFNSTVSSESADGVQLEGVAALVPAEDLDQIMDLYRTKSFPDLKIRSQWQRPRSDFERNAAQRFYCLKPSRIYKLDLTSTLIDRRIEVAIKVV